MRLGSSIDLGNDSLATFYWSSNGIAFQRVDRSGGVALSAAAAGVYFDYSGVGYSATFYGGVFGDVLVGGTVADRLSGNAGSDSLSGGDGDDVLNGGAGLDTMEGGVGDDRYFVDDADDVILEASGAGTDSVSASISYVLGDGIEYLLLTGAALEGTGNGLRNVIAGNGEDNTLSGLGGNDRLDGGTGADDLVGGQGNDTYLIDDLGDTITEGAGTGSGQDKAFLSLSGYALANDQHVEAMILEAGAATAYGNNLANVMIGNAGGNALVGGAGDDRLEGRDGNDILVGGAGADTLIGGIGADIFRFDMLSDAGDTIARFETGTDRIALAAALFGAEAPSAGVLDAALFKATAFGEATEAGDRVIFSTRTGNLYFDADGSGDGAAVRIARLTGAAGLSASDIEIAGTNTAPFMQDIALKATEFGAAVTVDLAAFGDDIDADDDGASLTYTLNGSVDPDLASISGTILTFDPTAIVGDIEPGDIIDRVFGVTVTDRHGATAAIDVTLSIKGVNAAPVAADDRFDVDFDGSLTLRIADLLGNDRDADGDTLTFGSLNTSGLQGRLTNNGDGTLTYNPNGAFDSLPIGGSATDSFTYTVRDGAGGSDTATVSLDVLKPKLADFTDSIVDYTHFFPNINTANSIRSIDVGDGTTFAYRAGTGVAAFVEIVGDQIILSTTAASIGFSQPAGGFHGFRVEDVSDMIADIEGVSLGAGSVAVDTSRITFTDDSVTFELGNLSLSQNDRVILDIDFA